jgi:subfamily B ATP-binding cassette protein MsbA
MAAIKTKKKSVKKIAKKVAKKTARVKPKEAPSKKKKIEKQKKKNERSTIQVMRIAMRRWLKPHWKIMTGAVIANLIVGAATGAFPVFIQQSLDILFDPKSQIPLFAVSGGVLVLLTVRAAATYVGNFLNAYTGLNIMTSVQYDLFKYFLLADFHVIGSQHSGQLVASFMNEARQVDGLIGGALVLLLRHGVTLLGVLGGMIYINWQLACFVLITMPPVFYFMIAYGQKARSHFNNSMAQTGNINAQIIETARGAKIIRAYGTEARELKKSKTRIKELLRNMARVQRARSASGPSAELIVGFGMAAIFFYVGYHGRAGNFSQGDLVGFITAMLLIYQPLKSLAGAQAGIQIARAATERVLARLDTKSIIVSPPQAPKLKIHKNQKKVRILFKDVVFGYPGFANNVLHGITFRVRPNQMVALVGHSGGGKSTILNLLERFYNVNSGLVKIDQQNVNEVSIKSLRESMSLVLQDVFLFDDTIAKNIAYAKPRATRKEIIAAAKLAHAHEFIKKMPQGYNTPIGEDGRSLSGGQRQRISFARAAFRNAPILLLDEPTSALDSESEEALQKGLRSLMKKRTVIIIAHRLSTIRSADNIFVVEQGRIIQSGKHEELMKTKGVYKNLYDTQFSNHK